jgi:hypothetical protein
MDGWRNPKQPGEAKSALDAASAVDNKRLMYLSGSFDGTPVVAGAAALDAAIQSKVTPNMVKWP